MRKRELIMLCVGMIGLGVLSGLHVGSKVAGAEETVTIEKSAEYFPDSPGSRWTYRGQISEGPLQTIELKFFTNVSTVSGTKPSTAPP